MREAEELRALQFEVEALRENQVQEQQAEAQKAMTQAEKRSRME